MPQQDPEIKRLTQAIDALRNHPFLRLNSTIAQQIWITFLRGMAFGLGSVLGATFLVYVLVQTLSQFEFIPILGDLAAQLIQQIESNR